MVVGGGGEIEDGGQSATYRQCVAGQEETLDAGHGEGSIRSKRRNSTNSSTLKYLIESKHSVESGQMTPHHFN